MAIPRDGAGLEDGLAEEVGLVGVEVGAERARQARERREHLGVGSPRRGGGDGVLDGGEQGSRETIDAGLVDFVWTLDPAPVEGRETRRAELAPHGSAGGLVVLRFCPPSLLPSVNLPDAWNSVFFLERTCVCLDRKSVV